MERKQEEEVTEEENEFLKAINFEKTRENFREMKNILKAKEKFNEFMDAYNEIDKNYQMTAFEVCFKEIENRRHRGV